MSCLNLSPSCCRCKLGIGNISGMKNKIHFTWMDISQTYILCCSHWGRNINFRLTYLFLFSEEVCWYKIQVYIWWSHRTCSSLRWHHRDVNCFSSEWLHSFGEGFIHFLDSCCIDMADSFLSLYFTHIHFSAIITWSNIVSITWSNIVRYYVNNYRNWGRVSIRCWIYKRHLKAHPNGRAMGCVFGIFMRKLTVV